MPLTGTLAGSAGCAIRIVTTWKQSLTSRGPLTLYAELAQPKSIVARSERGAMAPAPSSKFGARPKILLVSGAYHLG
jgi:hypothetical protein